MSGKKAKSARRAARASVPPVGLKAGGRGFWLTWKGAVVALAAVAVVGATFVTPTLLDSRPRSTAPAHAMAVDEGAGLSVGTAVPSCLVPLPAAAVAAMAVGLSVGSVPPLRLNKNR